MRSLIINKRTRFFSLFIGLLILSSCGGGSGSSNPPPLRRLAQRGLFLLQGLSLMIVLMVQKFVLIPIGMMIVMPMSSVLPAQMVGATR